jgi:hypothetical protein
MLIFNQQANIKNVNGAIADVIANRPIAQNTYYIFYSVDTQEIYYDNGNWILIGSAGGGGGNNIYNSNGSLTANRTLDGVNTHNLSFLNIVDFILQCDNNVTINAINDITIDNTFGGFGGDYFCNIEGNINIDCIGNNVSTANSPNAKIQLETTGNNGKIEIDATGNNGIIELDATGSGATIQLTSDQDTEIKSTNGNVIVEGVDNAETGSTRINKFSPDHSHYINRAIGGNFTIRALDSVIPNSYNNIAIFDNFNNQISGSIGDLGNVYNGTKVEVYDDFSGTGIPRIFLSSKNPHIHLPADVNSPGKGNVIQSGSLEGTDFYNSEGQTFIVYQGDTSGAPALMKRGNVMVYPLRFNGIPDFIVVGGSGIQNLGTGTTGLYVTQSLLSSYEYRRILMSNSIGNTRTINCRLEVHTQFGGVALNIGFRVIYSSSAGSTAFNDIGLATRYSEFGTNYDTQVRTMNINIPNTYLGQPVNYWKLDVLCQRVAAGNTSVIGANVIFYI